MTLVLLLVAGFGLLIFALLLLTREGATEPAALGARAEPPTALAQLEVAELTELVATLFENRGFGIATEVVREDESDLIAEDPTPVTGQRIYVRTVRVRSGGLVSSVEVQACL